MLDTNQAKVRIELEAIIHVHSGAGTQPGWWMNNFIRSSDMVVASGNWSGRCGHFGCQRDRLKTFLPNLLVLLRILLCTRLMFHLTY